MLPEERDFLDDRGRASVHHFWNFVKARDLDFDMRLWPADVQQVFDAESEELSAEWRRKGEELAQRLKPLRGVPRLISVYDGRDASGHPIIDRPTVMRKIHPLLLTYLESAPIILSARGFGEDEFAPCDHDVPLNFRTDGTWIWAGAVPHYLRKHGLSPEPNLTQHILDNEFQLEEVDEETKQRALEVITEQ
ncbi:hypothetical protein ACFWPX_22840 [Nocardia sp. NPDC058518]|uniref:hypothetical protein n=1 Tax=Nocardia sp. NPDC058518 TaxID=3346534 RepID=UPI0036698A66